LYWVAGVSTKSPVAEVDEPPSPGQALVEILAAEQALVGSQGLGAPGPRRRRPRMRSAWPDSGAGSTSRLFWRALRPDAWPTPTFVSWTVSWTPCDGCLGRRIGRR